MSESEISCEKCGRSLWGDMNARRALKNRWEAFVCPQCMTALQNHVDKHNGLLAASIAEQARANYLQGHCRAGHKVPEEAWRNLAQMARNLDVLSRQVCEEWLDRKQLSEATAEPPTLKRLAGMKTGPTDKTALDALDKPR